MSAAGIGVLDGSRKACRLPRDRGAAARGILGPRSLPQTVRRDYTFNSNDSFWLPNADVRLTGFPRVLGAEQVNLPRTRLAAIMAEQRLAGTDGLGPPGFTLDNLREVFFSNRNLTGELVRDPLVAACRGGGADLAAACDVLAAWDLRADAASRGAVLFREVWRRLGSGAAFATPFSKDDPLGTPSGLATDRVDVPAAIRAAVQDLQGKGIALDVPLGELQYEVRGEERLPMSGCPDTEGCFNILTTRRNEQGVYEPYTGSSFVMAAELTDDGPRGQAILRYSQSENPSSAHYADQTRLYAQERWLPLRFTEREIKGDPDVHAHAGDGAQMSRERPVAVGLVLAAAGSLQVGAAFAVTLFDELGPGGAAFLRLALAALVLWAIWRPRIPANAYDLRLVAAFGVALGLMNWSIYESMARIPLGVAVTIEFAGPLLVAVIGSRRPLDGVWVTLAAAGILLLADPGGGAIDGLGVLFAFCAAACWMAYIHLSKRTGQAFPGGSGLALAMAVGALVVLPAGLVQGEAALVRPDLLGAALVVALGSSVLPYSLELEALRRLPAAVFGVLMSLEPAVAALAGFVVLGQGSARASSRRSRWWSWRARGPPRSARAERL